MIAWTTLAACSMAGDWHPHWRITQAQATLVGQTWEQYISTLQGARKAAAMKFVNDNFPLLTAIGVTGMILLPRIAGSLAIVNTQMQQRLMGLRGPFPQGVPTRGQGPPTYRDLFAAAERGVDGVNRRPAAPEVPRGDVQPATPAADAESTGLNAPASAEASLGLDGPPNSSGL